MRQMKNNWNIEEKLFSKKATFLAHFNATMQDNIKSRTKMLCIKIC